MVPLVATATLGWLSALGDWIWFHYLTDGALLPAVVHGVLFFVALAMLLAWAAGERRAWRRLVPTLPWVGFGLAAIFYPLASVTGYVSALVVCWVAMWLGTAALQTWARGRREGWGRVVSRGLLAAIGSGLAFWQVSSMWTTAYPDGPPVGEHFLKWSFALLPGFLALLMFQPPAEGEATTED